jgi:periplasmic divalent cation tolerance protein
MSDIALVRVTFGDPDEAGRIGHRVIEERLAACVNVSPCTSTFRWRDTIEMAEEVTATFKTTIALAHRLAERIAELHSYDQPVIEIWPAAVDDAVATWVRDATET